MPRRPPVDKLPLLVRKDLRDKWENEKGTYEKNLTDLLGEKWTINIDARTIFAYAEPGSWAYNALGDCIASYVSSAEYKIRNLVERYGEDGKTAINDLCPDHTLTMDVDEDKLFSYCGCKVSTEGELVILFGENYLGTNSADALSEEFLEKALDSTLQGSKPMNHTARMSIVRDYNPKIKDVEEQVKSILGKEIALVPNFEQVFEKLKAAPEGVVTPDFPRQLGSALLDYFSALVWYLDQNSVGKDDMLQEAVVEALEKNAVHFRIVDKTTKSYNECVFENGILYLQTTPQHWWANTSQICDELLGLL